MDKLIHLKRSIINGLRDRAVEIPSVTVVNHHPTPVVSIRLHGKKKQDVGYLDIRKEDLPELIAALQEACNES